MSVLLEAVDVEAAMAVANAQGDGPLQVALARGQRATAAALLDAFPAACEGPWQGAPRPAARSLAAALHRLVRTVVETPASAPVPPPMPPDYAGCVRLLVERKGAPVDPRDSRGRTPLAASLSPSAMKTYGGRESTTSRGDGVTCSRSRPILSNAAPTSGTSPFGLITVSLNGSAR